MIKQREIKNEVGLLGLLILILIGLLTQACSVKVETQWFGETAKDSRDYTQVKK